MIITDIGYILVDNINSKNDLNKLKLISAIENYKKNLNEKKQNEIDNVNKYKINYENKRKDIQNKYNQYLRENKLLFDKWNKSKKTKDLYDYLSLKKPEYDEIEDIYTIYPISQP